MQSGLLSHPHRAKWLYVMRGMVLASALYPATFVALLLFADRWTSRPYWSAPHVRFRSRHR